MEPGDGLVSLHGVVKDYRGLRPLRVESFELRTGESVALLGFDAAMAEVLVNLVTGANLPDAGDVTVFGRSTRDITTADDWVRTLDRFGLISERAVLVDQFTAEQNLAMPLSLDIHDLPPSLRAEVKLLAGEVGLGDSELASPTSQLSPTAQLRLRLGRALALRPGVLLAEHPNASLPPSDAPSFAADFASVIRRRGIAAVVLTADQTFARAVADRVLTLQPATGALKAMPGWRRWF
jgi:ABC-type lipoprotein export system ATPase subunit